MMFVKRISKDRVEVNSVTYRIPPPEIRMLIYVETLAVLLKHKNRPRSPLGICHAISEAADRVILSDYMVFHDNDFKFLDLASFDMKLAIYPEIFQYHPKEWYSDLYWFSPYDIDSRINVLEKAIEDLKQLMYEISRI